MKNFKTMALCLLAVLGLYSCGSDKNDDTKEDANKVYLVKSLTITEDGDYEKYTLTYDNNKITKITIVDSDGETYGETYSYPSETSINCKSVDGEGVITMDASENVISKQEGVFEGEQYKYTYSFIDGYFSKENSRENYYFTYTWLNGNLTSKKEVFGGGQYENTTTIAYSDIENNTNIDFYLWLGCGADPTYTIQFMKNVSKNIPSSVKTDGGDIKTITTTLDEKGRPSKMVFWDTTYTFEYYD